MSVINILPEHIFNKIAAGEVISRPASVIKELVENSLDADAGKITVNVESAGSRLLSVIDDGNGMDPDDALLCLEPHATSKIAGENDIFNISSFGFRGEALPSIASVARVSIRSRDHKSLEGTEVIVEGGKFIKSSPVGCAPGTQIIVKDLFFNTPARRKFMKSPSTEEKHILETVYSLALPYPSVNFELNMDGRTVLSSPSHGDLRPRIQTFFGKSIENRMIPVHYQESSIAVNGYIACHGFTKTSRREQRIYINGRPVESLAAYSGIKEGYGTLIGKGRYPPVILFLKMDPQLVDVNVHPAKKEVRFRQERLVSSVITRTIHTALRNSAKPEITVPDIQVPIKSIIDSAEVNYKPAEAHPVFEGFLGRQSSDVRIEAGKTDSTSDKQDKQKVSSVITQPDVSISQTTSENKKKPFSKSEQKPPQIEISCSHLGFPGSGPIEIIGFFDETYILAHGETGLIVIDQHAAHERILYEKLLRKSNRDTLSQRLLLPVTIELSKAEHLFLLKNLEFFKNLGFEIEEFGNDTVLVHAIPAALPQENIGGFILDILSELTEKGEVSNKVDEASIAKAACGAAVKSHDSLTIEEARGLIAQMAQCELPYSCPHGRPTIINISRKELEKRFGRR